MTRVVTSTLLATATMAFSPLVVSVRSSSLRAQAPIGGMPAATAGLAAPLSPNVACAALRSADPGAPVGAPVTIATQAVRNSGRRGIKYAEACQRVFPQVTDQLS